MGRIGCGFLLLVLVVLCGEAWVYVQVARAMDNEWLGAALALVVLSIAGWRILRWRGQRLAMAMMGGDPGRYMVALLGAALLVLPGFATAVLGILLQIPPFTGLLARPAKRLMRHFAGAAAARMGGTMGNPAAGNPFANPMGGAFPGAFPFATGGLRPDQSQPFSGKTIDAKAKRTDAD